MKIAALVCSALFVPYGSCLLAESAPSLTIYNQNFAVVRDAVPLDLKAGLNEVRFADTTAHVETDSVMLRDPSGKVPLQILEQNYRNDPVSQEMLLSLNEGKTIDFLVDIGYGQKKTVQGKIIRSGYVPHSQEAMARYGQPYFQQQMVMAYGIPGAPGMSIIEVDGKLQFSLPGQPVFPALGDDAILKPALDWKIDAPKAAKLDAELAYVTGGMTWEADYNVVAPEKSDTVDITGWVTIDNQSGKTFKEAKIKLMAGDVSKIQPGQPSAGVGYAMSRARMLDAVSGAPPVQEKSFDEYHLYTLEHPTTLRDRETKQVEFIRATGVQSQRVYIYDGLKLNNRFQNWSMENIRNNESYGTECDTKVAVVREIKNSEANHLGMPLPKGRVRFYKRDADGAPEFTGENQIDHTARDETLRIYTGSAFDLVGERRRTDWVSEDRYRYADESFEITLRNHKKEPVEIRVVEHLYRWTTWEIVKPSDPFVKTAAQVIEFRVQVKPDEEKKIAYTAHYTW